ncbi:MAG: hypothetical protein MUP98_16070, partial [Candidatus Aminicenantes bacterium]|nr:hypothetical protein [Candidatus Aminicenantes bacterium]
FIRIHIQKFTPQKKGIDPDDILQEVRIKIWNLLTNEKKIDNYASYIKFYGSPLESLFNPRDK